MLLCGIVLLFVLFLLLAFVYWRRSTYWQRHGISGPTPWPLFGNLSAFFCGRQHYGAIYERIYKRYAHLPYVGIYQLFNEPALLICHETLIKDVLIRNFQHFQNNALAIDAQRDPIIIHNPFLAQGEAWRQRRTELAPMFTPTKVKAACKQMQSICAELEAYVAQQLSDGSAFEAKKLWSKYTLAVVATIDYGLNAHTLTTNGTESEFTRLVEPLFAKHDWSLLDTTALLFSPLLGRIIRYRYMPLPLQLWLRRVIGAVLHERLGEQAMDNANAVKHNDILQWLIDQQRQHHKQQQQQQRQPAIELAHILGHCGTLLLEGFETSSALMAFALYELARQPRIQRQVQREIDVAIEQYHQHQQQQQCDDNNVVCYEVLQQLHYMEAVLYETLRLYPPMPALFKRCTRDCQLPAQRDGGAPLNVSKGTRLIIPVQALHHDATLYAEPLLFKPERFHQPQQQQQPHQDQRQQFGCRFLSFGEGPRMCPGMRFGLAQSKAGLLTLLRRYNVHLAARHTATTGGAAATLTTTAMDGQLILATSTFLTAANDGIWLRCSSRE